MSTQAELDDRTDLLALAQRKIKSMENKERVRYKGKSREEYAGLLAQVEGQLSKARKQQEQTHAKLMEEKRGRSGADERCRSLRDNCDRQKAHIAELQHLVKTGKEEAEEVQSKLQHFKKEHRSAHSEASALKQV